MKNSWKAVSNCPQLYVIIQSINKQNNNIVEFISYNVFLSIFETVGISQFG